MQVCFSDSCVLIKINLAMILIWIMLHWAWGWVNVWISSLLSSFSDWVHLKWSIYICNLSTIKISIALVYLIFFSHLIHLISLIEWSIDISTSWSEFIHSLLRRSICCSVDSLSNTVVLILVILSDIVIALNLISQNDRPIYGLRVSIHPRVRGFLKNWCIFIYTTRWFKVFFVQTR